MYTPPNSGGDKGPNRYGADKSAIFGTLLRYDISNDFTRGRQVKYSKMATKIQDGRQK